MRDDLCKTSLIKWNDNIYRVLSIRSDKVLLIECSQKTMPKWHDVAKVASVANVTEEEMREKYKISLAREDELGAEEKRIAHGRYTLIAGVLPFLDDDTMRNMAIKKIAEEKNISRRTIINYLCTYLSLNDIAALAPKERETQRPLTKDQKNIRWALNKYYYTRHGNTLADAYIFMLKERYTDGEGKLLQEHPSIHQFRYYFRKTRSLQTEYITRDGIKDYEMNHRPLLGEGVREFAPSVGTFMVDATICDIYLVDEAGCLVGRPILVAAVDAYSGLCVGYSLLWEGGIYSVRELLLNIIADKVEWCKRFGICIEKKDWDCDMLPGTFVSDMGSEYTSFNLEQICELGCTLENLPSFRPELKGPVEKLFSLVQDSFKPYLKGRGVIEQDYQKRGAHDYRKDACLTIQDFEKIILHCILYHNNKRVLADFPYTEDMLDKEIAPHASDIWNYGRTQAGADLIRVSRKKLILTMLPRTEAKFARNGLIVNGLRYSADGYTDRYLKGGSVQAAYDPDDVSMVWLVEDGFHKFELIESRFEGKQLSDVQDFQKRKKAFVKSFGEENLGARVELAKHIEAIASQTEYRDDTKIKSIRSTRQKAKDARHNHLTKGVAANG